MNIVNMDMRDLKPYEKNPRKNDDAVKYVQESIKQFGFKVPIIIDKDNVIVAGHTRYKAAKKLGLKTVPCIIADDLTDEQIKAFRLADNKVAEKAEWDFDLLAGELDELFDFDMSVFGFEEVTTEEETEVVEDDFEAELPEEPKAQQGDIYQLGRHRLMCGDATNIDDVEKLINKGQIQLALTDPPYGIDVVQNNEVGGGGATHFGGKKGKHVASSTYFAIKGDDTTDTARENYHIIQSLTDNQIIFGGNYFTDFLFPSRCWVVWDKQNTGNFADAELAWTSFETGVKLYHFLWNGLCRAGSRDVEGKTRVHPTQKPVGLLGNIIEDFTKPADNVLDCFGGSGSTLMACEQTGRNCYMMEYEPHYIDVIINRWEKFTGQKAVLLNGNAEAAETAV